MLLKNVIFPHKLPTNFDVSEYEVIGRNGNELPISFKRNISHVKKIPRK